MLSMLVVMNLTYAIGFVCDYDTARPTTNRNLLQISELRRRVVCNSLCLRNNQCEKRTVGFNVNCGTNRDTNMKPKRVGQRCQGSSSCKLRDNNTMCYRGKCLCMVGFSATYNGWCVKHCERYGMTFSTYDGISTEGHNTKVRLLTNFQACKQLCIEEKEFQCVSVEMGYKEVMFKTLTECHLGNESYLDVPENDRASGGQGNTRYEFSTRNCIGARP